MIFVVIYVYVMYNLSLNSSGTDINKRKPTVRSQQKVKRIKVRLSGAVFFEKNTISEDSSFVPRNYERRLKGGLVYVMKRYHLIKKMEGMLIRWYLFITYTNPPFSLLS